MRVFTPPMTLALCAVWLNFGAWASAPQSLQINSETRGQWLMTEVHQTLQAEVLALSGSVHFRRIDIRAPQASIQVLKNGAVQSVPFSERHFFIGTDPGAQVFFSMQPADGLIEGFSAQGGTQWHFHNRSDRNTLEYMETPHNGQFECGVGDHPVFNNNAPVAPAQLTAALSAAPAQTRGAPIYQATLAVDTDNEFMWNKFNNNSASAVLWIEDMFAGFNTIYENELQLNLQIGTVFLRIDETPAGNPDFNADPPNFNDSLFTFSDHWNSNYDHLNRVFAMLLSGRNINAFSFSGIAWINGYCSHSNGYSHNRVGSSFSAGASSLFIGHEIGHNLGSDHTHCELLASGGTDYVDHCYSGENGCYVGATACPAGNNGTIMSYCHAPPDGFDGGGPQAGPPASPNCNTSSNMHSLIGNKLAALVAANHPACIVDPGTVIDVIYASGFD